MLTEFDTAAAALSYSFQPASLETFSSRRRCTISPIVPFTPGMYIPIQMASRRNRSFSFGTTGTGKRQDLHGNWFPLVFTFVSFVSRLYFISVSSFWFRRFPQHLATPRSTSSWAPAHALLCVFYYSETVHGPLARHSGLIVPYRVLEPIWAT